MRLSTRDVMVVGLVALLVATLGFLLSGMSVTGALGSGVPIAIGSALGILLHNRHRRPLTRRTARSRTHEGTFVRRAAVARGYAYAPGEGPLPGAPRRSRYGIYVNQRLDQDVDELDQDVDELVRRIEDLEAQLAAER